MYHQPNQPDEATWFREASDASSASSMEAFDSGLSSGDGFKSAAFCCCSVAEFASGAGDTAVARPTFEEPWSVFCDGAGDRFPSDVLSAFWVFEVLLVIVGGGDTESASSGMLASSSLRFVSNREKSGAALDLTVPPRIFSRATDVEGVAFWDLDHDAYQLLVFRISFTLCDASDDLCSLLDSDSGGFFWWLACCAEAVDARDSDVSGDKAVVGELWELSAAGLGRCLFRGGIMKVAGVMERP